VNSALSTNQGVHAPPPPPHAALRRTMVPITDVKRALAEARASSRTKLEEALVGGCGTLA